MSNTAIKLLKILLHGDIHIDEIVKYIELDVNSIERNISVLNGYLKEKGLSYVKKINNIYSLESSDACFADFCSKLDILTSDNRKEIYCIRILLDGYINLEKERQRIGVSRTTAVKDFKAVKEMLQKKDILLESRNSKGIFLKGNNESKITEVLCENLTRLFVDRDFLSMQRKSLLEEVNILDEEICIDMYKKLTETFKIRKSVFSFYTIYSMAIIERYKGKLVFDKHGLENEKEFKQVMFEFEKMEISKILSKELKEFVAITLLKIKYYEHLDSTIKKSLVDFVDRIKIEFKMQTSEAEELKISIANYFLMGCLNEKNGVFWIRKEPESCVCKKLAVVVQKVLDEIGIKMIYSDVLRLASSISRFFIDKTYVKGFKVMSVSRNLDEEYNQRVMKCMKDFYPEIEFYSETFLEFRFKSKDEVAEYDFIISDTENYQIKNLRKVNALNVREIQRCFIEYALEKKMKLAGVL